MNTPIKNGQQDLKRLKRSELQSHIKEVQREKELAPRDNAWLKLKFNLLVIFELPIGIFYYVLYIFSKKKPMRTYTKPHQGIFPVLDN